MRPFLAIIIMTLFLAVTGHAYRIETQVGENDQQEISKLTVVRCSASEKFCQNLCGETNECSIPETVCNACVSNRDQKLRTIFTEAAYIFRAEAFGIDDSQLIKFLRIGKYLLIPPDYFLNIFNPGRVERIAESFAALCPGGSSSALIIGTLNEDNELDQYVGVICQSVLGNSQIFPLSYNPEVSKERLSFWLPVNQQIQEQVTDSLQLRLSFSLQKNRSGSRLPRLKSEASPLRLRLSGI